MPDRIETTAASEPGVVQRRLLPSLIISVRPRQWLKNGLVLLALVSSLSLFDPEQVLRAVLATIDFTLLASATYLVNDLIDRERDRQHPLKRHRPIASGEVPPQVAVAIAAFLLVCAILLAANLSTAFAFAALIYLALTFSYSFWLKQVVVLDVLVVAAGFVVRAAAGAVAINVPISPWLYMCTMLGALFLVFSKRRHELTLLQSTAASHRSNLRQYSVPLLDQMISVVVSALVIAYSLYTFSAENLPRDNSMMLTIPFLLYGVFRYLFLVHEKGMGGSPEEVLLNDRALQGTVVGWTLATVAILYFLR